ncbi:putative DDE superfamily endonuclease [Monocercomonoides exilis]|uniref:putative DDE superfamily endonuclease n=1 Tax=Monocercomonoides exilis TaxID=2049356 RepID=UPI00355A1779|nr:putative DDE superfamily endonuclease [Monocercomonoides exilis]|eukprot:MONOS_15335.1-p1 / transcript=MONOS_15335.1 / gene=MONOS_15335 / organism=Monocercomonoides_exilis_PA203 / gene_product=unspecified product / transcript_product=unspecified product / location=Mono_scaffold01201:2088-2735(-) / protein_length=215 / sequence_SO=supercontig / SO=protein_coding / is_pseudo=false
MLHSQQHQPNATLVFRVFADGSSINPVMIWPSKTVPKDLAVLKYHRLEIVANGSGWMTKNDFEEIMIKNILPTVNKKRIELHGSEASALIIMDGHSSRLCWPVITWCREHSIEIIILPSHTAHLTQPLDRYVLAQFKKRLNSSFHPPTESGISSYRKALVPALADAVSAALECRTIKKSFYACGIEPFDPSVVLDRLPNQSSITKISSISSSAHA